MLAGLGVAVPAGALAPLLAAFAAVFLYIGACEPMPRSYALEPRPRPRTALAGLAVRLAVAGATR